MIILFRNEVTGVTTGKATILHRKTVAFGV